MKRTSYPIFFLLLIISTLYLPSSFAQDYTQWGLPEGAKARIGKGSVNDIQYSPEGTILAVAGSVGIWLYDAETLQELALLKRGKYSVDNIAFSPDSTTLVSGNLDDVILWDVNTREHKRTFENIGRFVILSPDGVTLASQDYKGIHLWNAKTGARKKTIATRLNYRASLVFSPDGADTRRRVPQVAPSHYGMQIPEESSRRHSQVMRRTFIVCRSPPMEKRSRVAVEIGPFVYGM